MQEIPIQAVPSQDFQVQLGGQNCTIKIRQRDTGLFLDLYVDNSLVIGGVICENRNRIVRSKYLGFNGDLGFIDMQGLEDPFYTGLGNRFKLLYLETTDPVPVIL